MPGNIMSDKRDQSRWVFLTDEDIFKGKSKDETSPTLCRLRHPRLNEAVMCLFSHDDRHVHEVMQFKEDYRSWFIDNAVQKDGSLYMTTPLDPIFMVLPFLISAEKSGKFMQLEQIVEDETFPESGRLCCCDAIRHVNEVTDVRGDDDFKAYKYNKEKTLSWLRQKVEKVALALAEKKINTGHGSQAEGYVQSTKVSTASKEDDVRYAHGIVSDYLPVSLDKDLKDFLGIKDIVHEKPSIEEPASKRAKKGSVEATEDYSKGMKKQDNKNAGKKISTAQKQLNKVDKAGMKSISSFFSAKPANKKAS